jgi:hypothetical protein
MSEATIILAVGTVVLAILFGARVAMRAAAGTNIPPNLPTTPLVVDGAPGRPRP